MTEARYAPLDGRGVLVLAGADTVSFLQALVTNDVAPAGRGRAVYAALLTPQGKYLHDFILVPQQDRFFLDCERARIDDLKRRLTLYRLRAKVTIDDASESLGVFAAFGAGAPALLGLDGTAGATAPFGEGIAYGDPRRDGLGARAVLPRAGAAATLEGAGLAASGPGEYDRLRHGLGIAEGGAEIGPERTLALEIGLDTSNGVSFDKGCYVGQEVTARMHNRGLVKKRIVAVRIEGPTPSPGTPVRLGDADAGELRAADNGVGLALLRLEALDQAQKGGVLTAGAARLIPSVEA